MSTYSLVYDIRVAKTEFIISVEVNHAFEANSLEEAKRIAQKYSAENPNQYLLRYIIPYLDLVKEEIFFWIPKNNFFDYAYSPNLKEDKELERQVTKHLIEKYKDDKRKFTRFIYQPYEYPKIKKLT
ncbi:hypothetical protein [Virgibacillus salexigens]|uniref:hypothetical protein n=1 Tax=Virgibacillus massiliensis TaxID=1462526 RepID=UPI001370AF63|nr:hypothetical protein [Virgibacillus massiliensis]MYL43949.1 hypothetical protein [Virgibacillus massiliensis]